MKPSIEKRFNRILVVDDNPDNIGHLFDFLTQGGFKVGIARDGSSAIESVLYSPPDLILLDIMMPGLNGFDVCQRLKSEPTIADIPIIFMTALDDTVNKLHGFALGAADYITKPIHYEEVLARINTHLNLQKTQKQLQAEVEIHKETAAQLAKQTRELEQRNQELNAFAHTVSHDLKTPLGSIMSLSELLYDEFDDLLAPDDKRLERLKYIRQAGQQGINIVDALLLLAGVSCQQKVELTPLNMNDVLERVIYNRLHLLVQRYGATFELPNTFPLVLGYGPWLEEVWMNYISNGLKYGGTPPHLVISTQPADNEQVCFAISDNGPGIDDIMQTELFMPFTRLETRRIEGHGLGLSIVRQIIEKLGGTVGAESWKGHGSQFYFTLPLVRDRRLVR